MKKCFNWNILGPVFRNQYNSKGAKFIQHQYLLQEIEAIFSFKING